MRAWMRHHLRMSDIDAGAMLRRAGLLNRFDAFAECAVTGALSSSQAPRTGEVRPPSTGHCCRELQKDLASDVADLDAAQTQLACDLWRQRADAIVTENEPVGRNPTRR